MSFSKLIIFLTFAHPYNNSYCTSMHVHLVHCEVLDVKHWYINQMCNNLFCLNNRESS